jgi:hypothetical protein
MSLVGGLRGIDMKWIGVVAVLILTGCSTPSFVDRCRADGGEPRAVTVLGVGKTECVGV